MKYSSGKDDMKQLKIEYRVKYLKKTKKKDASCEFIIEYFICL